MMARSYGASTADFTFDGDAAVAGVTLAVSTSASSAGRVTTGLTDLDGATITVVVSDADGDIRFLGDESLPLDLYVNTLDGFGNYGPKWYVVRATELGAAVSSAAASAAAAAAVAQAAAADALSASVTPGDGKVTTAKIAAEGLAPTAVAGTALTAATGVARSELLDGSGLIKADLIPADVLLVDRPFAQLEWDVLPALSSGSAELLPTGLFVGAERIHGLVLSAKTKPVGSDLRIAILTEDGTELADISMSPGSGTRVSALADFASATGFVRVVATSVGTTTPAAGVSLVLTTGAPPDIIQPPETGGATLVDYKAGTQWGSGTITVPKPRCSVGDRVFVLLSTKITSGGTNPSGTGWTLAASATATGADVFVFWRTADSAFAALAEGSGMAFTYSSSEGNAASVAWSVTGGGAPGFGNFSTGTSLTPSASATPPAGALVFAVEGDTNVQAQSLTAGSGWTWLVDVNAQYGWRHAGLFRANTAATGAAMASTGTFGATPEWAAALVWVPGS